MRFPIELWNSDSDRVLILTALAETASGPLVVIDRLGNTVFFNDAAERLWGERAEALVNRAIVSLLGLDRRRNLADEWGRLLETGKGWEGIARIPRVQPPEKASLRRWVCMRVIRQEKEGKQHVLGGIVSLQSPPRKQ